MLLVDGNWEFVYRPHFILKGETTVEFINSENKKIVLHKDSLRWKLP